MDIKKAYYSLRRQKIGKYAICLASGLLIATAQPGYDQWPLAWICMAPFLFILARDNPTGGFYLGLVMGVGMFGPTFTWISNSMIEFGHLAPPLAFAANVVGVFYISFFIGLFGYTLGWISSRLGQEMALVCAPFAWVGMEQLRMWIPPFSFPWARIADSQYKVLPIIQFTDITGEAGLCFLIVIVNSALASVLIWLTGPRFIKEFPVKWVIIASMLLGGAMGYSMYRLPQIASYQGKEISVALIQGNIDQNKKWHKPYKQKQLAIYEQRTISAARGGVKLVIWPETAAPFYFGKDPYFDSRMGHLAKITNADILFGALSYERIGKTTQLFNSAWSLSSDGKREKYDKVHLVPFGEYVPLENLLFFIKKLTAAIGNLQAGKRIEPILAGDIMLAPQICFEIIFPRYSRIMSANGADIIVNITNDSWFGRSAASTQSMAMAVFRAVENRKPVLRSAQSGISAIINQSGRITGQTGLFVETTLLGKVKIIRDLTAAYTYSNGLFAWAVVVGLFGFFGMALKRKTD